MTTSHVRSILVASLLIAAIACRSDPPPHGSGQPVPAASGQTAGAAVPHVNAAPAPSRPRPGMIWVPGGTFWMGCEGCGMPDALPQHLVSVQGFWMDESPVTNAEFAAFVKATAYVTVAERPLDPAA